VQKIQEALADAARREPDLASYYELHRRLLALKEQARGEITATLEMADQEALQARTLQGLPLLSFAQLPLDPARLARLVEEIAQVLTDHDVDVGDRGLPAVDWIDLAQQQFEAGQMLEEENQGPEKITLARMAVDLALKPYLAWAAEQVMPHVDQERWRRGYCPVCGGAPDFATLDEEAGARHLVCSRCDSRWSYRRVGCPFCGTIEHTKLSYYPSEDGVYRLYVCQECQRYLKTVDLRKAGRAILLPVERITTIAMDAAAQQEGYR
jgi:FdhE protein